MIRFLKKMLTTLVLIATFSFIQIGLVDFTSKTVYAADTLQSYKEKLKNNIQKNFKILNSENLYSVENSVKLCEIKDAGIKKIDSAKSKKTAKKYKSSYIKKMKNVPTLFLQAKSNLIAYINGCDYTQNEKLSIIEKINSFNDVYEIYSAGNEYGYFHEEYVETNPNKLTVAILNDEEKFTEFIKKWDDIYRKDGRAYYNTLHGEMASSGPETDKYMIYLINYQYLDKERTLKEYTAEVNELYEIFGEEHMADYDIRKIIDMLHGCIDTKIQYKTTIDFNSLIIENNDTKGVGLVINKIMKYAVKNKDEALKKQLSIYFKKYMGKNATLDYIVAHILQNIYYINMEYKNNNSQQIGELRNCIYLEEKIIDDYFLAELLNRNNR